MKMYQKLYQINIPHPIHSKSHRLLMKNHINGITTSYYTDKMFAVLTEFADASKT